MKVNRLTAAAVACVSLAASAAVFATASTAPSTQPLNAVIRAAERALRSQLDASVTGVELEALPLDPRLRLEPCAAALEAQAPMPRVGQARALVRVSCARGATWTVNVPIDMRRRVDVLVMKRAAARGETLGEQDVGVQSRVLPGLVSPFVGSIAELADRVTRRPIPAGMAVSADALAAALLIKRGQNVTLAAMTSGIEVRAPGVAMSDAGPHQRVRVQNAYSLKIVEGVADTDGVVRVSP
jgi:flagella basal body P-ring formation protein FlgA